MFRKFMILATAAGTLSVAALTLSAAAAWAKPLAYNYPGDPCRTAFEQFQEAKAIRAHTTPGGKLGGAEGLDKLGRDFEQLADRNLVRAMKLRNLALVEPENADALNKEAAKEDALAQENQAIAKKYREDAQKRRDEAAEYEESARKALEECIPKPVMAEPEPPPVRPRFTAVPVDPSDGSPAQLHGDYFTPKAAEEPKKNSDKSPKKKAQKKHGKKAGKKQVAMSQAEALDFAISVVGEIRGARKGKKLCRHNRGNGAATMSEQPRRSAKAKKLGKRMLGEIGSIGFSF